MEVTLFVDIELRKCTIKSTTESVNLISMKDSLLPLLYEPCRSDQIRSAICRVYLDLQIDSLLPDEFDKTCFVHWWQKWALCIRGPEEPELIGMWGLVPCQFWIDSLTLGSLSPPNSLVPTMNLNIPATLTTSWSDELSVNC